MAGCATDELTEIVAKASWDLNASIKWDQIPEDWKPRYRACARASLDAIAPLWAARQEHTWVACIDKLPSKPGPYAGWDGVGYKICYLEYKFGPDLGWGETSRCSHWTYLLLPPTDHQGPPMSYLDSMLPEERT